MGKDIAQKDGTLRILGCVVKRLPHITFTERTKITGKERIAYGKQHDETVSVGIDKAVFTINR